MTTQEILNITRKLLNRQLIDKELCAKLRKVEYRDIYELLAQLEEEGINTSELDLKWFVSN